MNSLRLITVILFSVSFASFRSSSAQNSMGVGTDTPNPNAVLELVSPTNNQGFLVPRYSTAERTAISFTNNLATADNGLMVFDSDEGQFYFWFNGVWQVVTNVSSGGDMTVAIYDSNADGIVDNAATVNSLSVETAVPVGAVFTDAQIASGVTVTPTGNLVSTEVQSALEELQTKMDTTKSSEWTNLAGNLSYNLGNVGVGTTVPLSQFQVGEQLNFFHYENVGFQINAEIIGDNMHPIGDDIFNSQNGYTSMILFEDGNIEFLHGDSVSAGASAISAGSLANSLTLKKSYDAEFRGAVEIGQLRDSTNFSSGTVSFGNGGFWGFTGSEWTRFGGLSFPSLNSIDESGSTPFVIENTGTAGIARFTVNNIGTFSDAVSIITNSEETSSSGLELNHDGLGSGAEVFLNNANNTQNAIYARTIGTGYAGRFEVDNVSNNVGALVARVDNGNGGAIEGYTQGLGQAASFTLDNVSNGSIAMSVNSNGSNSAAYFSNSNSGTSTSTVEISNNGIGAGLTIQNPGGTTSFGDVSFINGDLGIGQFSPSAKLDVVGDTELNGDISITGNLTNSGAVVHSGTQIVNNANYAVQSTDYIINLNGSGFQNFSINLPKANDAAGRELILVVQGTAVHYDIVLEAGDNFARNNGAINANNLLLSQYAFGEWYFVTLKSVGNNWYVTSFLINGAA